MLSTALTLSIMSLAFGAAAQPQRPQPAPASAGAVANMLTSDMSAPPEAHPHGVPTAWDWAKGPRPRRAAPPADFTAFTAWGQLYRCAGAKFDPDATIEVRDLQTWLLAGGHWRRVQRSSAIGGSAFPEDYRGSPVPARVVARGPAGTKVRLRAGYNFHFWPGPGRIALDPRKVSAVAVIVRARRTGGSRAGCVTLSVGADYWRSLKAPSAGATNATDAGIGRFKRVRGRWRAFSMTTATAGTLARHPLPLRLPASELR